MRKILLCMLAAGVLGVAAPAFASDNDRGEDRGGIDVGPLGQCFDLTHPSACRGYARGGYARGGYAYGFAPFNRYSYGRHHRVR